MRVNLRCQIRQKRWPKAVAHFGNQTDCRTGSGSDRMPALNVFAGGFSFDETETRKLSGRIRSLPLPVLQCSPALYGATINEETDPLLGLTCHTPFRSDKLSLT